MDTTAARPWGFAEFFAHFVYLTTMVINGGLFLFLPEREPMTYMEYRTFLLVLTGAVALTVPAVFLVYRQFVSPSALEHIRRTTGEGTSQAAFKLGSILITCLGDFSGIAGASFFTYTRDTNGLALFLGGWAVQYGLTAFWVARGKKYFQRLAPAAAPSLRRVSG